MASVYLLPRSFVRSIFALSGGTRALLGVWVLFFLLVIAGIHGSSTGVTASWWAPEKPYSGYLFWKPGSQPVATGESDLWRNLLMANARWIRWDELLISTPLALGQLSHRPKFPVVNTNVGAGQNMLTNQYAPVWHIATLARPSTWGYFVFGAQRGLAWHWWFQSFAAFTALYLLFEILLRGRKGLAAFGAFWYCASAYIVGWSLWPAYVTFFIALGCLAAYHLCRTEKTSRLVFGSLLLGLSLSGFFMALYPPWQVPLGYLFLLLFVGLFLRDKLYLSFKSRYRFRLLAFVGAAALAGLLIGAYLFTCLPDLRAMSATVYPGQRISLGGDYSFALLFEGMYNLTTLYRTPQPLLNQSEAASFYYLFPAVLLAMILSRRFLVKMGLVGWLVGLYVLGMLFFFLVGVPETVARLTFLGYVPPYRADAALGLASIILCMQGLALAGDLRREGVSRWERVMPWLASGLVMLLFFWHGREIQKLTGEFFDSVIMLLVPLFAGLSAYFLLRGRALAFCGIVGAIVVLTTGGFNPLSTNLDHIYDSELAREITRLNQEAGEPPMWICYGGVSPGMLVTALGGKSLSGQHWPPQLSLWRRFDPSGVYENEYNRYALVHLVYGDRQQGIRFQAAGQDSFIVTISPLAPLLKSMGARYVLIIGEAQEQAKRDNLLLAYRSSQGHFSIYEIPP
jgi:hypothetical protein